jgi:hypothetical protein
MLPGGEKFDAFGAGAGGDFEKAWMQSLFQEEVGGQNWEHASTTLVRRSGVKTLEFIVSPRKRFTGSSKSDSSMDAARELCRKGEVMVSVTGHQCSFCLCYPH